MKCAILIISAIILLSACATNQEVDFKRSYIHNDTETCSRIKFMCAQGMQPFSDETGCGCEPQREPGDIIYVSESPPKCRSIKFDCLPGYKQFSDDSGCGCKPKEQPEQFECAPAQKNATVCAEVFNQSCGWFGKNIQCIKYPCAQTFSNPCFACQHKEVAYYTQGECPSG